MASRKPISFEDMELIETDDTGQLFWKGKAVVMEQRFTLGSVERVIAGAAALATVVAALWPILVFYNWAPFAPPAAVPDAAALSPAAATKP